MSDATVIPADLGRKQFAYVTTTGRRSGREHTIEIWFATNHVSLYLISGGGDRSDWVRNLAAQPKATVRIGDTSFSVAARLPLPEGEERTAAVRLLHTKHASQVSGSVDGWLRDAFIVALDPHHSERND